jgi:phage gpG-like protein
MKPAKWIQRMVKIPKAYNEAERKAIAQDLIDYIAQRTQDGKGKGGQEWSGSASKYSKSYRDSLAFQVAGKGDTVDLTLTGDMLSSLELIADDDGALVVGIPEGSSEAGKAEGNIRGSYGQSTGNRSKARDFLALTKEEIKAILENYPLDDDNLREQSVAIREAANQLSGEVAEGIDTDTLE